MRDHSAQVGLLALALLCACEDPEQDKFMSFGGISPDCTRSCTFTQVVKFAGSAGAYFNVVRSRPPSLSTSL